MSKVIKGVGKVFKKVVKTVAKVAPYVVAAGAVIFTAGAALGVGAMAGGWGAAASSVAGSLGLGSTTTSVLAGALTQAGYGAAIGGLVGGKAGLKQGAMIGAATGAATGLLSPGNIDPLKNVFNKADALGDAGQLAAANNSAMLNGTGVMPSAAPTAGGAGATGANTIMTGAPPVNTGVEKSWLEANPTAAGMLAQGAGTGLMALAGGEDSKDAAKLTLQRDEDEAARIKENYGVTNPTGLLVSVDNSYIGRQPQRPTADQKYGTSAGYTYDWDPIQRRLVQVPMASA